MPDFDCLHRQFQTRFLTYWAKHHQLGTKCKPARLCSDLESAVMAVARPATTEFLLQKGGSPLCYARCASSHVQGRSRPLAVAGSVSCCAEQQRISSRCIALPATLLPSMTGPRNTA